MENTKTSVFEKKIFSSRVKSANVKPLESLIGYLIGPLCGLLANGIFNIYLTTYFREVLFAGEVASQNQGVLTFLTLFPLLSSILIIIGNLVAGQVVQRTMTKAGKARPWIIFSSIFLPIMAVLMFIQPSNDTVFKMVWTAIVYNLYYAIAFPLYTTANSTLTPLSTRNGKQRSVLASFVSMASLAAAGAGSMVFPILLSLIVGGKKGVEAKPYWLVIFIIIAVVMFIGLMLQFYFTRERVTEERVATGVKEENLKLSMKEQASTVIHDKFFWIIIGFYLLYQLSGGIKNSSMRSYSGILDIGIDAEIITSVLGIVGAIPMALAVLFVSPLCNKFGKQKMAILGMAVGCAGGIMAAICYDNIYIAATGIAIKCLGAAPGGYMILAMIADVIDHIEAKTGKRCDTFIMSIYSSIYIASVNIGQGITNGLVSSMGDYGAVVAYIWIESIAYGLAAILLCFFTVEKFVVRDNEIILERQKEACLAAGKEWIPPEERLKIEEAKAEAEAEEARIKELRERCEKKHLDFDAEEAKYQAIQKQKAEKKAAKEAAKQKKDK